MLCASFSPLPQSVFCGIIGHRNRSPLPAACWRYPHSPFPLLSSTSTRHSTWLVLGHEGPPPPRPSLPYRQRCAGEERWRQSDRALPRPARDRFSGHTRHTHPQCPLKCLVLFPSVLPSLCGTKKKHVKERPALPSLSYLRIVPPLHQSPFFFFMRGGRRWPTSGSPVPNTPQR